MPMRSLEEQTARVRALEKEAKQKNAARKKALTRYGGLAAAFLLVIGCAVLVLPKIIRGTEDINEPAPMTSEIFDGPMTSEARIDEEEPTFEATEKEPTSEMTDEDEPTSAQEQALTEKTDKSTLVLLTANAAAPEEVELSEAFKLKMADFSCTLLREMAKGNTSNRLVSAVSVANALGMAEAGAEGNTLSQMEALLGLPRENYAAQMSRFRESLFLPKRWEGMTDRQFEQRKALYDSPFRLVNAVFCSPDMKNSLRQSFADFVAGYYGADVGLLDFSSPDAVQRVNEWCREKTDGMIPALLNDGALTPATDLLLVNTLTMDAMWRQPYAGKGAVKLGLFHGVKGEQQITMLHSEEETYLSGESEIGFVKPYQDTRYAFVALLPNEEGDIDDYLSTLTGERFLKLWQGQITRGECGVKAAIPKFSVDDSVELREILRALGMTDAFSPTAADFSGLTEEKEHYIAQVLHKTHLELDEYGTRAGAATLVTFDSCPPDEMKIVTLDRPFVYGIVDTETGIPLFLGCCRSVDE